MSKEDRAGKQRGETIGTHGCINQLLCTYQNIKLLLFNINFFLLFLLRIIITIAFRVRERDMGWANGRGRKRLESSDKKEIESWRRSWNNVLI